MPFSSRSESTRNLRRGASIWASASKKHPRPCRPPPPPPYLPFTLHPFFLFALIPPLFLFPLQTNTHHQPTHDILPRHLIRRYPIPLQFIRALVLLQLAIKLPPIQPTHTHINTYIGRHLIPYQMFQDSPVKLFVTLCET